MSQVRIVSLVARLWVALSGVWIAAGTTALGPIHPPTSYCGFFPWGKGWHETEYTLRYSAKVKNEWHNACTFLCAFMACTRTTIHLGLWKVGWGQVCKHFILCLKYEEQHSYKVCVCSCINCFTVSRFFYIRTSSWNFSFSNILLTEDNCS
jgi:hypothetical protein